MKHDEQLWLRLKEGDRGAFELLFHLYYQDLYRYGFKFCGSRQRTEDELQNLFLKIWEDKEKLGDVKAVKTYLWTSLRRRLIAAAEKMKREQHKAEGCIPEPEFSLSAEEFIIKGEQEGIRKKHLKKAIQSLSPKQREILYLKFYEGMSYEEIEDIMAVNYQVTRNYLYLGLQKLRKKLPEEASALLTFLFGLTAL